MRRLAAFDDAEKDALATDAERLFRGSKKKRSTSVLAARGDAVKARGKARRVSSKKPSARARARGARDPDAVEATEPESPPEGALLPHLGEVSEVTPRGQVLGRGQACPHRPQGAGSVVVS